MSINATDRDTVTPDNSELGIEDFRYSGVTWCSVFFGVIALVLGIGFWMTDGTHRAGEAITIGALIWLFCSACRVQEYADASCSLCWYNYSRQREEETPLLRDGASV